MRHRVPAITLVLACIARMAVGDVSPPAPSNPLGALSEVLRLEEALEYEKALVLADNLISRGGLDTMVLVQLHFEAGKLAAGLDHADAASEHFLRALALDPSLSLPAGASPKLAIPFAHARQLAVPLSIGVQRTGPRLEITTDDRMHLVAGVQVLFRDAGGEDRQLVVREGPPYVATLPAGARGVRVVALEEHGNRIYDQVQPDLIASPPPARQVPRAWYARWTTWGGLGVVALAAGGVSAWRFSVAQDDWNRLRDDPTAHDYSQLRALEDRGRGWALAANISFGVAGVAALGALIAVVASPRVTEPSITLTAAPGSVGVAGRF